MAVPSQNLPTSPVIAPADPGDSSLAQTLTGMSAAGNNCGIGIAASAVVNPKTQDWDHVERLTMPGQYLGWGGDSVVTGQEDADIPDLKVADYVGVDFNDTVIFTAADAAVTAKDAIYDTVSGAILKSELPVATVIGDFVWGAVPVA